LRACSLNARTRAPAGACAEILLGLLALLPVGAAAARVHGAIGRGLPSDAELERRGAVIGRIIIRNENIFDLDNPKDNKALFRLANRLHPVTRQDVIRQQLLFHTGERYSRHLLDESARILRADPYFYDASVRPVRYHDGKVDVLVVTRDVWTLDPGFNFSRSGGTSSTGFEVEDINTLGTGTDVQLSHSHTVDRTASSIEVSNQHTLGTWVMTDVAYGSLSDGKLRQLIVNRPFYSLEAHHAGGIAATDITEDSSLYDRGQIIDRFSNQSRFLQLYGGWSAGLAHGWVRRWSAGITDDEHRFGLPEGPWSGPTVLPADRKFVYPWLRFDLVQDQFIKLRNRNQIGRTEDFDLGAYATVQAGWASAALGSSREAVPFMLAAGDGYELTPSDTLLLSGVATGRIESGVLRNGVLSGAVSFFDEQSSHNEWLFFTSVRGTAGRRLDLENQILLGGDNGLRGYPLRYQDGTSRLLYSAEERYFSDWFPLRLFRVGAAVFFDMGRTWGRAPLAAPGYGWLRDVGFGLRFGNARTGLGNVIHVDLAFPLDARGNISRLQFLVQTEQQF
jgi:hypothetical protein